jgi:nicotinamide phosphoribosyltransferase
MSNNAILLTDSYKVSQYRQYIPGTEVVYSYLECREGSIFPEVCFFGLQYCLKRYLEGKVVTKDKIDEADALLSQHFNNPTIFNRRGWEHILNKHDGHLPVSIKAVSEGTCVPISNVIMTVENTDPECFWLTNYLETVLMSSCWYASTVATQSREMKKVLLSYLEETGDPLLVDFKVHDFGFRGVSSVESAGIGGCAHLVNFRGTDTLEALVFARDYYGCPIAGYSIPAAEHSTMTSWGQSKEKEAFKNMLEQYPEGMVAVVSDSYDINNAILNSWHSLKEQVLSRKGILVIRPDSGKLPDTVLQVLGWTGQVFGMSKNEKGYLVINPKVRIIQGDGIDFAMMKTILQAMKLAGWSADNVAFGSGGGLLQKLNRDTMRFAFKCSSITVNGIEQDVFKSPAGDPRKSSKPGRLKLVLEGNKLVTVSQGNSQVDHLLEVFRDGRILLPTTLDIIRERAFVV